MQQRNLYKDKIMGTQKKQIKAHLEGGYRITAMDALNTFGCFRLASRISDLKSEGYPVDKVMVETDTGARIAQYYNPNTVRGG
tara:strand:- start:905 stop:1153 length:249 start_codon:yes stop_codon:yes gene_type:complete